MSVDVGERAVPVRHIAVPLVVVERILLAQGQALVHAAKDDLVADDAPARSAPGAVPERAVEPGFLAGAHERLFGTYFYFRDQTGIESHFSVRRRRSGSQDGHIWQFMNTDRVAEANWQAVPFPNGTGAISIETEDDGDPDRQP